MSVFCEHPESEFLKSLKPLNFSKYYCDLFEKLWDPFSVLADNHFWGQLDKDPKSRLWEMMVAYVLKQERYELTSQDKGPDFLVLKNGKPVMYVEAIAPSTGEEGHVDAVPEIDPDQNSFTRVPNRQILLRFSSAFYAKSNRYREYVIQGVVKPNIPLVIAINSGKVERASGMFVNPALQFLLGFGRQYLTFSQESRELIEEGIESRDSINKSSGKPIDMTPFLSEDHSHISGVLYSDLNFWSIGWDVEKETIFVHNPNCKLPISTSTFTGFPQFWTVICSTSQRSRTYQI